MLAQAAFVGKSDRDSFARPIVSRPDRHLCLLLRTLDPDGGANPAADRAAEGQLDALPAEFARLCFRALPSLGAVSRPAFRARMIFCLLGYNGTLLPARSCRDNVDPHGRAVVCTGSTAHPAFARSFFLCHPRSPSLQFSGAAIEWHLRRRMIGHIIARRPPLEAIMCFTCNRIGNRRLVSVKRRRHSTCQGACLWWI